MRGEIERIFKIMNLTNVQRKRRGNVENNTTALVNIRFIAKISDDRNFFQSIRSEVETSEVATLLLGKSA